jgi:hypothetical protein
MNTQCLICCHNSAVIIPLEIHCQRVPDRCRYPVFPLADYHELTGLKESRTYAAASGVPVPGIAFIMQSYVQKNTSESEASI